MNKVVSSRFLLISMLCLSAGLKAQYGSIDPYFGENGISLFQVEKPALHDVSQMLVQSDNRIVLLSYQGLIRTSSTGKRDFTFGTQGVADLPFQNQGLNINHMALGADGKILVTGEYSPGDYADMFLTRLNQDGTLDNSFGDNGLVDFDLGGKAWETGHHVVELPDQSILLLVSVGNIYVPNGNYAGGLLMKFRPDGSFNTDFGENGIAWIDFPSPGGGAGSMAVQEDGKILMLGTVLLDTVNYLTNMAVLRYHPDGTVDTSFGTNGIVSKDVTLPNDSIWDNYPNHAVPYPADLVVLQNGDYLISGRKFYVTWQNFLGLPFETVYDTYEMFLCKIKSNGVIDSTFGRNGILEGSITFSGYYIQQLPMEVQEDGKILVGHHGNATLNNSIDFAISRYYPDGRLDSLFGDLGTVRLEIEGKEVITDLKILEEYGRFITLGIKFGSSFDKTAIMMSRFFIDERITGLEAQEREQIRVSVYPNPFLEQIYVSTPEPAAKTLISFIDNSGRIISQRYYSRFQEDTINVSGLPPGIYFIRIKTTDFSVVRKLIK